jgi:hypothetical protein
LSGNIVHAGGPAAAPPPGACYDPFIPDEAQGDGSTHRPLIGGARIMVEGSSRPGTIGCFLEHETANPKRYYVLTNNHVCSPPDVGIAVPGKTLVGSPTGSTGSTGCCSDIIGTFVAGRGGPGFANPDGKRDADRDEAVVQLKPGIKFRPATLGIGAGGAPGKILGKGPAPTKEEVDSHTYAVRKYGQRTGLTGGVLIRLWADSTSTPNALEMRGNPNPECDVAMFMQEGDSGSVLINNAGHIIALLSFFDAADGSSFAYLIDKVLKRLKEEHNLPLKLVISNGDPNEVITVPGAASVAVPHEFAAELVPPSAADGTGAPVYMSAGVPWPADAEPAVADTITGIRTDLEGTERGRLLLRLWQRNRRELVDLVGNDRTLKVAWYRNGGAALVQLLLRMADRPETRLPRTVHDVPLDLCLERFLQLFAPVGSDRLLQDLAIARAALPDPADLPGMTYRELMDTLGAERTSGNQS